MGKFQAMRRKKEARRIALERMDRLYNLSIGAALANEDERCKRYIFLMRRIGMRYNVPVPTRYKTTTCRKCYALLVTGKNSKIRLKDGRLRVECLSCGYIRRFPYNPRRDRNETTEEPKD